MTISIQKAQSHEKFLKPPGPSLGSMPLLDPQQSVFNIKDIVPWILMFKTICIV